MYVRGYLQGSENGRVVTIDGSAARPDCAILVALKEWFADDNDATKISELVQCAGSEDINCLQSLVKEIMHNMTKNWQEQ
jgi:hypothetical protein